MTRFGNLVPLETQKSHLDTPGYLVGYIVVEDNKMTMYTWEIKDLILVLSKKSGSTLVNV